MVGIGDRYSASGGDYSSDAKDNLVSEYQGG